MCSRELRKCDKARKHTTWTTNIKNFRGILHTLFSLFETSIEVNGRTSSELGSECCVEKCGKQILSQIIVMVISKNKYYFVNFAYTRFGSLANVTTRSSKVRVFEKVFFIIIFHAEFLFLRVIWRVLWHFRFHAFMSSHFILFFKFEFVFVINGSTEGGKVQGQAKKIIYKITVCVRDSCPARARYQFQDVLLLN